MRLHGKDWRLSAVLGAQHGAMLVESNLKWPPWPVVERRRLDFRLWKSKRLLTMVSPNGHFAAIVTIFGCLLLEALGLPQSAPGKSKRLHSTTGQGGHLKSLATNMALCWAFNTAPYQVSSSKKTRTTLLTMESVPMEVEDVPITTDAANTGVRPGVRPGVRSGAVVSKARRHIGLSWDDLPDDIQDKIVGSTRDVADLCLWRRMNKRCVVCSYTHFMPKALKRAPPHCLVQYASPLALFLHDTSMVAHNSIVIDESSIHSWADRYRQVIAQVAPDWYSNSYRHCSRPNADMRYLAQTSLLRRFLYEISLVAEDALHIMSRERHEEFGYFVGRLFVHINKHVGLRQAPLKCSSNESYETIEDVFKNVRNGESGIRRIRPASYAVHKPVRLRLTNKMGGGGIHITARLVAQRHIDGDELTIKEMEAVRSNHSIAISAN